MKLDPLLALSALDGRYRSKIELLAPVLSEFGLLHARVEVECRWLKTLCNAAAIAELPALTPAQSEALNDIHINFDLDDAVRIKTIERTTNH